MAPEITTRPATEADWPQLWPLLQGMGKTGDEEASRQRVVEIIHQPDHLLLLAVYDGAVIGYAWAHDYGKHIRVGHSTARLNDLFVAPEHRRKGAARALMAGVTAWAEERGVTWLQWQASEKAVPFYEKLGYTGDPCPDPEYPFYEIQFRPFP